MEENLKKIAQEIVNLMWGAFGPEVEELFFQKLVQIAAERWRFRWEHSELMSDMINKATRELLETTFKPALDKIAVEKARAKVKEKASKANVDMPQELLFPETGDRNG